MLLKFLIILNRLWFQINCNLERKKKLLGFLEAKILVRTKRQEIFFLTNLHTIDFEWIFASFFLGYFSAHTTKHTEYLNILHKRLNDANGTLSHSRLAWIKLCSLTFHIYHKLLCSYFPVFLSYSLHSIIQIVRFILETPAQTEIHQMEYTYSDASPEGNTHFVSSFKLKTQHNLTGM